MTPSYRPRLDNSLKLSGITHNILNRLSRRLALLILLCFWTLTLILWEPNTALAHLPASAGCELHDACLVWEEEEGLGRRNWEGWVGDFAAGGDLGADAWDENLLLVTLA